MEKLEPSLIISKYFMCNSLGLRLSTVFHFENFLIIYYIYIYGTCVNHFLKYLIILCSYY